jgi:prefoldin subunit 5
MLDPWQKQPWQKQPGETPAAYRAFCQYRDLGPNRTALNAFRQAKGRPQASNLPGVWTAWCSRYRWPERAAAYDAHLERESRQRAEVETIKRRAEMLRKHQQAGELLRARGVEYFTKQKVEDGRTAIAAVKTGIDVERQAEGLPTWVVELMNADEHVLRERIAELEQRRRQATVGLPDSPGDALSVAGRNGHGNPELQPAGPDREAGGVPGPDGA